MVFCPGRKAKQIEGPITKVKSFTMEESTTNKRGAGSKPSLCSNPLGEEGFKPYNYLMHMKWYWLLEFVVGFHRRIKGGERVVQKEVAMLSEKMERLE